MKKYTLVLHSYMGYGSYYIQFKRVRCKPALLKRYNTKLDVHFVIDGWPVINYPNEDFVFESK